MNVDVNKKSAFPVIINFARERVSITIDDAKALRDNLISAINKIDPPNPMRLEKAKTNSEINIRGPYKGGTAYIGRFFPMPEYEKIVDWIVANYPANQPLELTAEKRRNSA